MDYDSRKVTEVDVWGVQVHRMANGETNVSGSVKIAMSNSEGGDNGPSLTVGLAALADSSEPTIRGAELSLLTAAIAFVERVGREDVNSLRDLLSKSRDEEVEPNPFATVV